MLHCPKDFQEYFLRRVRGVGRIIDDAVDEPVNWLVKFSNEPRICLFRTCFQFCNHCGFRSLGTDSAGKIDECNSPRHNGVALNYKVTSHRSGNLNSIRQLSVDYSPDLFRLREELSSSQGLKP